MQVTKKSRGCHRRGERYQATSAVAEGCSITTIEFRLEVDRDRALNDVKDAVSRTRAELPRTVDEPIVTRVEIEGLPIVTYGARAPGKTPEEHSWFVDDVVMRALQGVKGVSQIERFCRRAGRVSTEAISKAVRIATIGDIGAYLAKFDVGERQVPIRVQLHEPVRADRQTPESLKVATAAGAAVPLIAVARFELGQRLTAIDRYNRSRRVAIGADLVGDTPLGKAVQQMLAQPAVKQLPPQVEIRQLGDAEIMAEVFESLAKAMAAGIMTVYAVLVWLFGSFLQPLTILLSLPLSIGGAIVDCR